MKAILLIAHRELMSYFRSWMAYIIMAGALLCDGLLFNVFCIGGEKRSAEVLSLFFYNASGVAMIAGILLSTRLLAEERQTGTINLLCSSPIRDHEIVLGKYFAAFIFMSTLTIGTFYIPMLILVHGKISLGHIVVGYLGLLLLGGSTLAIGTLGSSLARSQVLAAAISGIILLALILCWNLVRVTERPFSDLFPALALWNLHFKPFMEGTIHLRDVVYYFAVIYMALFGATRVLEARRWR